LPTWLPAATSSSLCDDAGRRNGGAVPTFLYACGNLPPTGPFACHAPPSYLLYTGAAASGYLRSPTLYYTLVYTLRTTRPFYKHVYLVFLLPRCDAACRLRLYRAACNAMWFVLLALWTCCARRPLPSGTALCYLLHSSPLTPRYRSAGRDADVILCLLFALLMLLSGYDIYGMHRRMTWTGGSSPAADAENRTWWTGGAAIDGHLAAAGRLVAFACQALVSNLPSRRHPRLYRHQHHVRCIHPAGRRDTFTSRVVDGCRRGLDAAGFGANGR